MSTVAVSEEEFMKKAREHVNNLKMADQHLVQPEEGRSGSYFQARVAVSLVWLQDNALHIRGDWERAIELLVLSGLNAEFELLPADEGVGRDGFRG